MFKKILILSLGLVALAGGCNFPPVLPTRNTILPSQTETLREVSPAPSRTPLPPGPGVQPSPTVLPSITWTPEPSPTPTVPQARNLNVGEFQIIPQVPITASIPGVLVIERRPNAPIVHLMKFIDGTFTNTLSLRTSAGVMGVSPNGEWIFYGIYPGSPSSNLYWYVQDRNGKQQKRTILPATWRFFGWIGSDRVIFRNIIGGRKNLGIENQFNAPAMVLNPFTGEQEFLPPDEDFPGLKEAALDYASIRSIGMIFDSSLNYVAFPQGEEQGCFYALWDRLAQKLLARTKINGCDITGGPNWLPDERGFLIASLREWFEVNKDGTVRQLTHLMDSYADSWIDSSTGDLSPDGHYLAFTLYLSDPWLSPASLAILDLWTLELTVYKPSGSSSEIIFCAWSPDSRYLAVDAGEGTYLVDIIHQWRTLPFDLGSPIDWLK